MANVVEFSIKAVDKFSGTMSKISKSLLSVAKTAAKFGAAAIAGAVAVTLFVGKMAKLADQAAKTASKLGVPVKELTRLQFAANVSGVSTETFNMALQRMTRRVAEAAVGTGELLPALKELGINAEELGKKTPDQQLKTLADAFAKVENQSDKVRLAFKAFDSEGVALVNLVGQGSEAMEKMAEDADFLGRTLDEQATANATAFADSMLRAKSAIGGASQAVAQKWMPIMTGFANATANAIAESRESIAKFAEKALNFILFFGVGAKQIVAGLFSLITDLFGGNITFKSFAEGAKSAFLNMFDNGVAIFKSMIQVMGNINGVFWLSVFTVARDTGKNIHNVFITGFPNMLNIVGQSFVLLWEQFFTLANSQWENVKALFTGDDLISLEDLFFKNIPEATQKTRDKINELWDGIENDAPTLSEIFFKNIPEDTELAREQLVEALESLKETVVDQVGDTVALLSTLTGVSAESIRKEIDKIKLKFQEFGQVVKDVSTDSSKTFKMRVQDMLKAWKVRFQAMNEIFSNFSSLMSSKNKTAFRIGKAAAKAGAIVSTYQAAANALASYPFPFSYIAMAAAIVAGFVQVQRINSTSMAAHGGITNLANDATVFVQRGERILSQRQNVDFTDFINRGGQSQSRNIVIEEMNISMFENVTQAGAFLEMDQSDVEEIVAQKLIPAFDRLTDLGIGQLS